MNLNCHGNRRAQHITAGVASAEDHNQANIYSPSLMIYKAGLPEIGPDSYVLNNTGNAKIKGESNRSV